MKFELGDKVVSKKTGYPGSGEVCGVVYAAMYVATTKKELKDFECWNDLYPDWHEKHIVYVRFDEPRRTVTFEEFCRYMPEHKYDGYDLQTIYAFSIPYTNVIAYPIEDLEFFDKDDDPARNIIKSAGFNE